MIFNFFMDARALCVFVILLLFNEDIYFMKHIFSFFLFIVVEKRFLLFCTADY